jgi:hypothetical protein
MALLKYLIAAAAGLVATVTAHGNVWNFTTDGTYNQGFLRKQNYTDAHDSILTEQSITTTRRSILGLTRTLLAGKSNRSHQIRIRELT